MRCVQGIKKLKNVTIGEDDELYFKEEKIEANEKICLSPTDDDRIDAYVCRGYSENAVEDSLLPYDSEEDVES